MPDFKDDELATSLEEIKDGFLVAYRYKANAYENMKESMNTSQIENILNYKNSLEEANTLLISAGLALSELGSKIK